MASFPKTIVTDQYNATPLYQQLAEQIRGLIKEQAISAGQALPSERELMEITGTSRVTIRKALGLLLEEGLLLRRQGSGTYIAPPREQSGDHLSSFTVDAKNRGESPSSVWLVRSLAPATEDESRLLSLPEGAMVARFGRLRLANGEPLAIEHAVVPAGFVGDPEAVKDSLYQTLKQNNKHPQQGTQKIRASKASPIEAGLLNIHERAEVLRIERRTFLADGTPVEYTHSVYRGDKYVFVSHLHMDKDSQQD